MVVTVALWFLLALLPFLLFARLQKVHRATLPGGQAVVVKVRHDDVAALVAEDLGNLCSMAGIAARLTQ